MCLCCRICITRSLSLVRKNFYSEQGARPCILKASVKENIDFQFSFIYQVEKFSSPTVTNYIKNGYDPGNNIPSTCNFF